MPEQVLTPDQAALNAGDKLKQQQQAQARGEFKSLDELPDDLSGLLKKPEPKPDGKSAEQKAAATTADKPVDKAADKTTDTKVDDMPPEIARSTKAAEHWKRKDEAHAKKVKELQEQYEKQMAELKAKSGDIKKDEYETLKKRYEETEAAYKRTAGVRHPEFIEKHDKPIVAQVEVGKRIGGEHGDKIAKLLQLPDSDYRTRQLDEIMEELSPSRASQLGSIITNIDLLRQERESAIQKMESEWETISKAEQAKAEQHRAELNALFESALKEAVSGDDTIEVLKEKEGDVDWNRGVRERLTLAKAIYNNEIPPRERADAALWASIAPELVKQTAAQTKLIAELQAKIKTLESGVPSMDGEDAGSGGGSGDVDQRRAGESDADWMARRAASMGFVK